MWDGHHSTLNWTLERCSPCCALGGLEHGLFDRWRRNLQTLLVCRLVGMFAVRAFSSRGRQLDRGGPRPIRTASNLHWRAAVCDRRLCCRKPHHDRSCHGLANLRKCGWVDLFNCGDSGCQRKPCGLWQCLCLCIWRDIPPLLVLGKLWMPIAE